MGPDRSHAQQHLHARDESRRGLLWRLGLYIFFKSLFGEGGLANPVRIVVSVLAIVAAGAMFQLLPKLVEIGKDTGSQLSGGGGYSMPLRRNRHHLTAQPDGARWRCEREAGGDIGSPIPHLRRHHAGPAAAGGPRPIEQIVAFIDLLIPPAAATVPCHSRSVRRGRLAAVGVTALMGVIRPTASPRPPEGPPGSSHC